MLSKEKTIDVIEVTSGGIVQVRSRVSFLEDGVAVGHSLHRHVVCPGDDISSEDPRVKAVCAAVHTPDVIAAFKAAKEV